MKDYSQPDFYRFNEDSLRLVKWIMQRINSADGILDLGAGSGIIGIELANQLQPQSLDLLEVQKDFYPYLKNNLNSQLKIPLKGRIIEDSFGRWIPERVYDLIVCNPPYYLPGHGEKNKDPRKECARSFVVDDWERLLSLINIALAPEGRAFIVIKNDQRILREIQKNLNGLEANFFLEDKLMFIELSGLDKN